MKKDVTIIRIVNSGPKQKKLSGKDVAELVGAEKHNYSTIDQKIEEISSEGREGKELLATTGGISLVHCINIACRYCPDFWDKVKYYYRSNLKECPSMKGKGASYIVEFYR